LQEECDLRSFGPAFGRQLPSSAEQNEASMSQGIHFNGGIQNISRKRI
jgi:hypothetical protein